MKKCCKLAFEEGPPKEGLQLNTRYLVSDNGPFFPNYLTLMLLHGGVLRIVEHDNGDKGRFVLRSIYVTEQGVEQTTQ